MPRIGEKKNCISAQVVTNSPMYSDERAMLPFKNSEMSFGKIGTMIPNASMSNSTVTKTNPSAACRLLSMGALLVGANILRQGNRVQCVQPELNGPINPRAVTRSTVVQQETAKPCQHHGRVCACICLRMALPHQGRCQESEPVFYGRS